MHNSLQRVVTRHYTLQRAAFPHSQNCPFPWAIWTGSNTWFLGPIRLPTTHTASRLVQPFLHGSPRVSLCFTMDCTPLKIASSCGRYTQSNTRFLALQSQPKRHIDRFGRFAGLTTVTDRPTDQDIPSVTICRIASTYVVRRCTLVIMVARWNRADIILWFLLLLSFFLA